MKMQKFLLISAASFLCLSCRLSSDSAVEKEFLSKNPNAEITGTELIFEQNYVAVYLINYREKNSQKTLTSDFALKRENSIRQWRDDQTDRKC